MALAVAYWLVAATTNAPIWAAVVAGVVSLMVFGATRQKEDVRRRRSLYSEAYKAALEWCEAVYRVRRRAPDGSEDRELVARLHELQERLAYHEGLLSLEHEKLGAAYRQFLDEVMAACKPLLRDAWAQRGRPAYAPTPTGEPAPNLADARKRFLKTARRHLNEPWDIPYYD